MFFFVFFFFNDTATTEIYTLSLHDALPISMMNAVRAVSTDDNLWQAVMSRDMRSDGRFVYGVRSTGIYCRPSCPSRRPKRESVRFFAGPDVAELAGFRECRRCRPRAGAPPGPGLEHVRKAATYIAAHADAPITLSRLASHV